MDTGFQAKAHQSARKVRLPLEKHDLAADMLRVVNDLLQAKGLMMRKGAVVDATLIAAPSS